MLNNREMETNTNNLAGTYYKINQQAPTLPPEFIFTYINNDNNISTNTGSIDEIEINSYPPVIYKNKGFEVSWTGKPVQEGETITATLDGKNFLSCTQSTSVAGEQSIHFKSDQLKGIKPGKANIVIARSKNLFLKEVADPEGSFSLEYISKKVETLIQ